jgi:hypothetical protein
MRRRDLIKLLASATFASPRSAIGGSTEPIRQVGGRMVAAESDPDLRLGLAALPPGAVVTSIPARPTEPVIGALAAPLKATVNFRNGTVWNFDEQQAVDLGDYIDPQGQFTQQCHAHAPAGVPMTVFFRRDASGTRPEVVFELGWQSGLRATDLGAYTATIKQGITVLATVSVPNHYWYSRWRWQSAPRPARRMPAQIFAANDMLPMATALAPNIPPSAPLPAYTPMAWSNLGLLNAMGTTGERSEIGLITQAVAEWLCTGTTTAYANMMAQAEAHSSVPVHFRDDTMSPVSIARYPYASTYQRQVGGPWFGVYWGTISPNTTHYPALCYIPFLVTGDPYYLEELQFAVAFHLTSAADPQYRGYDKGIQNGEVRGVAWGLRDISQVERISPAATPSWLLPKSYFTTILANNLASFISLTSQSPDAFTRNCHFFASWYHSPAPWQSDFLAIVCAWMANAGHADWAPSADWTAQEAIDRSSGLSGNPRSQCIIYYYQPDDPKMPGITDWPSLAKANNLVETADGLIPRSVVQSVGYWYTAYLQGVLAVAMRRGQAGAQACYNYVHPQSGQNLASATYKWAFKNA